MKKLFTAILLLALIFLFGCDKNKTGITTTSDTEITATDESLVYDETLEITQTQETSGTISEAKESTEITASKNNASVEDSPPVSVEFNIAVMKDVLEKAETLDDESFKEYIKDRDRYASVIGTDNPAQYKKFIEDSSEIYLAVVDDNYENVGIASKDLDDEMVSQIVYMEPDTDCKHRFVISIKPKFLFESNDETTFIKTIETDEFTADIYWSETRAWKQYAGNIYYNGDTYTFRAAEMDDLDLVENELSRLSFVKIGDLLSDSNN